MQPHRQVLRRVAYMVELFGDELDLLCQLARWRVLAELHSFNECVLKLTVEAVCCFYFKDIIAKSDDIRDSLQLHVFWHV